MKDELVDMGIKQKEMYSEGGAAPKSEKDYENEKRYPEVHLSGPHAEMMGAEDLKEGDLIEQTVRWRVKRHTKTTENGKTNYSMDLCLEKASDCKDCEMGESAEESDDDEGGETESPGLAYITGRSARSED